jgi:hypothetical protein
MYILHEPQLYKVRVYEMSVSTKASTEWHDEAIVAPFCFEGAGGGSTDSNRGSPLYHTEAIVIFPIIGYLASHERMNVNHFTYAMPVSV